MKTSKQRNAEYYAANKEKERERNRRWFLKNKDKRRKYYMQNKSRKKETGAAWEKKNKARRKLIGSRRRAKMVVEDSGVYYIYRLSESRESIPCYWCGKKTSIGKRHVYHIVPLSKGGPHASNNLCISCPSCNLYKKDLHPNVVFNQGILF